MVRLKSRTQCPVNGFQFIDAAISPTPMQTWDFEQLCREIQDRRTQNPRFKLPTDINAIRQEVDQQNALRMLAIKGAESYITAESGGASPNRVAPQNWRTNVVGGVKRVVAGAGILRDWLGAGGVSVSPELSAKRAAVCAVCPQNQAGDFSAIFTQPVAERIRAQLAMKNDMNLTTALDDKLQVCAACSCPLKLKVHTPMAHIKEHLSEEVKAALDKNCWILSEP